MHSRQTTTRPSFVHDHAVRLAVCLVASLLLIIALPRLALAQVELQFNDSAPTLETGTALTQGARYRFHTVAPGTDALVTLTTITGGAVLVGLDDNTSSPNRFQPTIRTNGSNVTTSYVKFDFQLVASGTSTARTVPAVYLSAQDVDGSGVANSIREWVEFASTNSVSVAAPTFLSSATAIAGGTRYIQSSALNIQAGIGTDDHYEVYTTLNGATSTFSILGGNVIGSANCAVGDTGCDRLFSFAFDPASSNQTTPAPDVSIIKTGPSAALPSTTYTYTLTVRNHGPTSADGSTLSDALPGSFVVQSYGCTASGGAVCPALTSATNLFIPTFPSGGQIVATISGYVATASTVNNTATIVAPNGSTDPDLSDNSSSVATQIGPVADLRMVKSQRSGTSGTFVTTSMSIYHRSTMQYQLVVTNLGTSSVSGATFTDTVPANLTGMSVVSATGVSSTVCSASFGSSPNQNVLTGSFSASSGGTCTVIIQGTATTPGAIANTAYVAPASLSPTGEPDCTGTPIVCTGNNLSSVTTTIQEVYNLTGTVFEDTTYSGGAGRSLASSGGVGRGGVRVELYNSAGAFVGFTTTASTGTVGQYQFANVAAGNYTVRVVSTSVASSRAGWTAGLYPVQTFRTSNGSADTARVGGEVPAKSEAGDNSGSQSLASLTTASVTPLSIAPVQLTADRTGVDFGYNFNTIVNTNDSGQGSLRMFMANANALSGADSSVFMISDGGSHPGLTAGLPNLLTSGVAVITLSSELPLISQPNMTLDATSQTTNVGDTNSGSMGTGGTVGVDAITLPTVPKPEVQISDGTAGLGKCFSVEAASATIRGFSIYGFGSLPNDDTQGNIRLNDSADGSVIEYNVLGTTASSFTDPGASARTPATNLRNVGADSITVRYNLIGYAAGKGIESGSGTVGSTYEYNEVRGNAIGNNGLDGIDLAVNGTSACIVRYNLIADQEGVGIDMYTTSGSHTVVNNIVTNNGLGGIGETPGIRVFGSGSTIDRNVIYSNYGAGIMVTVNATTNTITRNSIYANGTISSRYGHGASGQIGIDLQAASQNENAGTSPFVTQNDNGDGDNGANGLPNFPVIESAKIYAGQLVVKGFARPGANIEFFIAAADPSGLGEGQTYLFSYTEGSGSDTDSTTGSYSSPYNGVTIGADNTNRFQFMRALPSNVTVGTQITSTATLSSATSEFGNLSTVANGTGVTITGTVFEDATFGGGAGRSLVASGGSGRGGATVELYDSAGALMSTTTTASSGSVGQYQFSSVPAGSYTVRVVNSTVTSSRSGYIAGLLPVQTFRTSSGAAETDRVGGEDPTKTDAAANSGSQTLASLTTSTTTPESIGTVVVSSTNVTGVDFGFNFDTIVSTRDSGQGSLRQFITNANALSGADTSVFMISDGSAHSGLRSGLSNQLTAGVAVITLTTNLPALTDASTTLDATTQTTYVGNTNSGTLGTGGTVGTDALTLSTVNRPEVQISDGSNNLTLGFDLQAANLTVRGFSVYGFGNIANSDANTNFRVSSAATSAIVEQNVIGATAASFSDPGAATRSGGDNLRLVTASGTTIRNNLIGFSYGKGIGVQNGSTGTIIQNNEIRGNGIANNLYDGVDLEDATTTGATITGNLFADNEGCGIDTHSSNGSHTITNNTVTNNGIGGTGETAGIRIYGSNSTIGKNIIYANYGAGIQGFSSSTSNTFTQNSIYLNGTIVSRYGNPATGQIGIDLNNSSDQHQRGTAPFVTANDSGDSDAGANGLLNFPVIESAVIVNGKLVVTGFARPGAIVELFTANTDASGFGEGQTYLTSFTEGSVADLDATTGTYASPYNGLAVGTDTTNRFRFSTTVPSGVAVNTPITATATLSSSTSEFSNTFSVTAGVTYTITGNVFEDASYNGGAGRSLAASGGTGRGAAIVELYDSAGAFVSSTTTASSGTVGQYQFTSVEAGSYTVRVVNSSVTSARSGYVAGLLPVQTYRTSSAAADANRVGGEDPAKVDAAANSTSATLASLTTSTTTAQSVSPLTIASANATDIDFGFNFDTIVNVNNSGQGSLRQFIENANALSGADSSIFMITDGAPHAGLRSGLTSQLTSGVAVINVTSALPAITGSNTTLDATTQTTNVGNTNSGSLGTGGTVGVDGLTLSTVAKPEIQLSDNGGSIATGLNIQAASAVVRGFAIFGFGTAGDTQGQANVYMNASGTSSLIEQNVLGTTATAFTDPGGSLRTGGDLLQAFGTTGVTIRNNLAGFAAGNGIVLSTGVTGALVENNEIRGNAIGNGIYDGLNIQQSGSVSDTVRGNLITANEGCGIDSYQTGGSHSIVNNTINGNGTSGTLETPGIRLYGIQSTIDRNIISANFGAGVMVISYVDQNTITKNSIFSNGTVTGLYGTSPSGQIGIDLLTSGDDSQRGTAPFVTQNDSGDGDWAANALLNFPVIDAAFISNGNLVVTGFARPGATLEFFIGDGDPSGFGEGQTFLFSAVEGGGSDTDATSGTYSSPVGGVNVGSDTTNRFSFTVPLPSTVAAGSKVTATATVSSSTSEFGNNAVVSSLGPSINLVKSVSPAGAQLPGTDLTFSIDFTNSGGQSASNFRIVDPDPANVAMRINSNMEFKVGSVASTLGTTGLTLAVTYSNDNAATFAYTPVSGGGGAPAGYDGNVTHIRWTFTGSFSSIAPNNAGGISFMARIK